MPISIKIMEIWEVSLQDAIGHEQSGSRPAIVIAVHLPTKLYVVVPLTSNPDASRFPFTHRIARSSGNGLSSNSIALIFQLRCIGLQRFIQKIGILEKSHFDTIKILVKNYLGL